MKKTDNAPKPGADKDRRPTPLSVLARLFLDAFCDRCGETEESCKCAKKQMQIKYVFYLHF